jgi:Fe-Mn family superoxide dismutase
MTITLPQLPFKMSELEPYISRATLQFHHNHHHRGYVNKVNEIAKRLGMEDASIEDFMNLGGEGTEDEIDLYKNACQVRNHNLYWSTLCGTTNHGIPSSELMTCLKACYGSITQFKKHVFTEASKVMGSGWVWVLWNPVKEGVDVVTTKDYETVGSNVLFVVDLWEHAYYIDHPADRTAYLEATWNIINWNVVNDRFATRQLT